MRVLIVGENNAELFLDWTDKKGTKAIQIYDDCKKIALEHLNANRYNRLDLGRVLSGFRRRLWL
jgi:hypothetical protein